MGNVSISKNITIQLEEKEKEILSKAYDILKDLWHDLFIEDDDCDEIWEIEQAKCSLENVLDMFK